MKKSASFLQAKFLSSLCYILLFCVLSNFSYAPKKQADASASISNTGLKNKTATKKTVQLNIKKGKLQPDIHVNSLWTPNVQHIIIN